MENKTPPANFNNPVEPPLAQTSGGSTTPAPVSDSAEPFSPDGVHLSTSGLTIGEHENATRHLFDAYLDLKPAHRKLPWGANLFEQGKTWLFALPVPARKMLAYDLRISALTEDDTELYAFSRNVEFGPSQKLKIIFTVPDEESQFLSNLTGALEYAFEIESPNMLIEKRAYGCLMHLYKTGLLRHQMQCVVDYMALYPEPPQLRSSQSPALSALLDTKDSTGLVAILLGAMDANANAQRMSLAVSSLRRGLPLFLFLSSLEKDTEQKLSYGRNLTPSTERHTQELMVLEALLQSTFDPSLTPTYAPTPSLAQPPSVPSSTTPVKKSGAKKTVGSESSSKADDPEYQRLLASAQIDSPGLNVYLQGALIEMYLSTELPSWVRQQLASFIPANWQQTALEYSNNPRLQNVWVSAVSKIVEDTTTSAVETLCLLTHTLASPTGAYKDVPPTDPITLALRPLLVDSTGTPTLLSDQPLRDESAHHLKEFFSNRSVRKPGSPFGPRELLSLAYRTHQVADILQDVCAHPAGVALVRKALEDATQSALSIGTQTAPENHPGPRKQMFNLWQFVALLALADPTNPNSDSSASEAAGSISSQLPTGLAVASFVPPTRAPLVHPTDDSPSALRAFAAQGIERMVQTLCAARPELDPAALLTKATVALAQATDESSSTPPTAAQSELYGLWSRSVFPVLGALAGHKSSPTLRM